MEMKCSNSVFFQQLTPSTIYEAPIYLGVIRGRLHNPKGKEINDYNIVQLNVCRKYVMLALWKLRITS
jgi:hypothetical protein